MGNILIVEDDPNIRKLVRVNLAKRGYTVSEAEDSHQAIALFQQVPVDLVLLDLLLPGLSGVDVCTWIRARSDVPIIVLSARLEEDLKVAALDAGADDYVTKPFGQEELLARVRAFLRRSYVSAKTNDTKIQIGELCIDLEARRILLPNEGWLSPDAFWDLYYHHPERVPEGIDFAAINQLAPMPPAPTGEP